MQVVVVYLWHSNAWTPRNEALMEAAGENHKASLVSGLRCQHGPNDFRNSLWFREKCVFLEVPQEGISTCRSPGQRGELIESTCDYVIC